MQRDERHGGPYDRGYADAFYGRPCMPHYYVGKTGLSERVQPPDMDGSQIDDYCAGYEEAERLGDEKDWGE